MLPNELLTLRGQVYAALGVYHQAAGVYWDAFSKGSPPEGLADTVRASATSLDQALTALLNYLHRHEPGEGKDQQIQRASRLQELLHHELELLD